MSLLIRVYMNRWLMWIFLLLCRTLDVSFVPSSKEQLLSGRDQCYVELSILFSSELKLSCCYGLILMVPKGPHANVWVAHLCCYQEIVEPSEGQGLVLPGCNMSKFLLLFCFHHQALPHRRVPEQLPMETSESVSQRRSFNLPSLNLPLRDLSQQHHAETSTMLPCIHLRIIRKYQWAGGVKRALLTGCHTMYTCVPGFSD